ncbi:SIMPL domain-containing protein [Clostridium beijerinckii]|uniref:SIMPL domain-containing protein n=1 Tax=Clostridium beijerinckii TaxID=1520 RepID=UPI001F4BDB4E|nr:SIMPL domain-containing protein [Clostridium beijerinckii]
MINFFERKNRMHTLGQGGIYSLNDFNNDQCSPNRLKVIGKGTVSVKPDLAEIVVGVITEDLQLEVAQEENAKITQEVINSIRALGIPLKNIQTENYSIRPNYDYINGKQVFRGYEVINNLKILISNINNVGEVIDTAVSNGANSLTGIIFIVSDETKYYYEALRRALQDAQNKARVVADQLKVKLNTIPIQINEQNETTSTPLVMTLKSTSNTTPIEAGENIINADIEAIFTYVDNKNDY